MLPKDGPKFQSKNNSKQFKNNPKQFKNAPKQFKTIQNIKNCRFVFKGLPRRGGGVRLAAAAVEQGLPALVLPRKKAELQTPRQPLLVGLPPPAPARARTWAQVASTGSAAPKRRLGDAEEGRAASPEEKRRKEDEKVLASLREAQDESAHYEDALAALLQS